MYFQKKPMRVRLLPVAGSDGQPRYDAAGNLVLAPFPIPEPWRRVTPKLLRPGFLPRQALAQSARFLKLN